MPIIWYVPTYEKLFAQRQMEDEQSRLKGSVPEMESYLENAKIQTEGLQRFIDKAKRVTQLTELTPELVHEFIQKIVVSKPEYRNGKRYQGVEIYYNGVGIIIREPSPEEVEEYFHEHMKRKAANACFLLLRNEELF